MSRNIHEMPKRSEKKVRFNNKKWLIISIILIVIVGAVAGLYVIGQDVVSGKDARATKALRSSQESLRSDIASDMATKKSLEGVISDQQSALRKAIASSEARDSSIAAQNKKQADAASALASSVSRQEAQGSSLSSAQAASKANSNSNNNMNKNTSATSSSQSSGLQANAQSVAPSQTTR